VEKCWKNPFCGGGMDIFWNYTFIRIENVWRLFLHKNVSMLLLLPSPNPHPSEN